MTGPRPRLTVRRLMRSVALCGLLFGGCRLVLPFVPFIPQTGYAPGLDLGRFDARMVGMTRDEVLDLHGPPLWIYVYDSRTVVQDQTDPRFSGGSRVEVRRLRGRPVKACIYKTYKHTAFNTSEHWEYSRRTGGSSHRKLVASFDLRTGKITSVYDGVYFD